MDQKGERLANTIQAVFRARQHPRLKLLTLYLGATRLQGETRPDLTTGDLTATSRYLASKLISAQLPFGIACSNSPKHRV